MYLKSIEVQGFKSFANKIVFEFHNGITGIVGPNGSGKSNVADAVRWVLGEQRAKQLRGGNMQDVIFAGTQLRKPQGFASVSITLDNSDHQLAIAYDEVTVSRRLYRSGESEYKMNGTTCRLKDIQELFYDTGIGKEGYSIIGQGQIDKILSGKPEERRELFDEAAGIVKFKRRKAIAQKKLENEKQNLVRVSDILLELEKQVGPLEKQSETAKKFLQLRETLKTYEVNGFLLEVEVIKKQLQEVLEHHNIVSSDLESSITYGEELKETYGQIEQSLERLSQVTEANRLDLSQSQMKKGTLEGQINVLLEQINTEHMHEEHMKSRMTTIEAELEEKNAQITSYQLENEGISKQFQKDCEKLKQAEGALEEKDAEISKAEQTLDDAKTAMIAGLNERASYSAKEQRYMGLLEQVQIRRSEVMQKLLKIKSDESLQEEQIHQEESKLFVVEEELVVLKETQEENQQEELHLGQELNRLSRNLQEQQQQYRTDATKLESLRNLAERYDGYGNSIRRVMEARDRIGGVRGVVADLITTKQQYETAIETALGGSIQNVVTDSEQTAKQLIEYLKKNKYGRVTFLPLTSIGQKSGFSQKEALKETGVIGLASELVHVAPEYQVLATYLLGRVVVVDTIDHAIALAKKYRYSLRIVTLEGELLSAGGSMTGGAFKNSSNLLGRKREIEELEQRTERAFQQVNRIQKEQEGLEEQRKEVLSTLEVIKEEIQKWRIDQNTLQMRVEQLQTRKQEVQDSGKDLVLESSQLEAQMREIDENKEQIQKAYARLDVEGVQINQQIEDTIVFLEEGKGVREQLSKELELIRLETASLKQKVDFVEENVSRIEAEQTRLEEEKAGLHMGTRQSSDVVEKRQQEIVRLQGLIAKTLEEGIRLEEQALDLQKQKEDFVQEQKSCFQLREEVTQKKADLDKELFRLDNQKEKVEEKVDQLTSYMWNEYELTLRMAEDLRNDEWSNLTQIRSMVHSLKLEIKDLGHVNVNAIEDYKEVFERFTFIKNQHDDLVQAEEVLLKIIEELDVGMRRQFEEKFRAIKEEFNLVFQEMFGGGTGTLELMEGVDILEAGVQIISQPPGKKLQNMMQLSGGEKALTAIALLFAIQNLKPSPFCLLDEIEAALDDSNVDRFAKYLHKLIAHTQFIVITHRRGTMVASDRLYGITMQEKGVSTLVSVNLIEDQLDE